ncbi:MAG: YnbE family lipoprotein [Sneathiellales bacterium]|nr:YnbE family lipoprotein [Sneathiellales bacterium]
MDRQNLTAFSVSALGLLLMLQACSPTVKVEAPSEPITINLNIKLDAEVRLKIEEDAKDDIENNPEIF